MKKFLIFAFMAMSLVFMSCKSTEQEDATTDQTNQVATEEKKDDGASTESFAEKNNNLLNTVDESRQKAIDAGAQDYYASQLKVTDEMLLALKEKAKDSDKDLSTEINDVNYRYLALENASKAKKLKEKIQENGFAEENKEAFDAAENCWAELEKLINDNAAGKDMFKASETVYDAYYAIYFKSYKKLADNERKAALEQKKNADNVKAGVAKKDEYKKIVEIFNAGDSCYVTKNPEGAFLKYKESKEKFSALYADVSEKRAAAQKRIDEAKQKVLESQNFASQADEQAPLGDEKISGIEEKDAVLLEQDKFENPDNSVINVDEEIPSESKSEENAESESTEEEAK